MPIVEPPAPRHSVQDDGTTLEIIIPTPKNWIKLVLGGLWVIPLGSLSLFFGGYILFEVIMGLFRELQRPSSATTGDLLIALFALGFASFWLGAGAAALYAYFWDLSGKEIVQVTMNSMTISRQLLGYKNPKEYLAEYVRNLRVSSAMVKTTGRFDSWKKSVFKGPNEGTVAFDYGAKTYHFGIDIDEAEAEQIVATILRHFSQYGKGLLKA